MIAALALVLFAVAVPAAAAWAGHRSAVRGAPGRDEFRAAMRRYGLSPVETGQVESAVMWGKELQDERLRRAAVDWAKDYLEQQEARRRVRSRGTRVAIAVLATVVVIGAAVHFGFVDQDVPWTVVVVVLAVAPIDLWMSTGPQRAIRLNSDARPPVA